MRASLALAEPYSIPALIESNQNKRRTNIGRGLLGPTMDFKALAEALRELKAAARRAFEAVLG
jgi:hypothetical protein